MRALPSGKAANATVLRGAFKVDCPTLFRHKKKKMNGTLLHSVIVDKP